MNRPLEPAPPKRPYEAQDVPVCHTQAKHHNSIGATVAHHMRAYTCSIGMCANPHGASPEDGADMRSQPFTVRLLGGSR